MIVTLLSPKNSLAQTRQDTTKNEITTIKKSTELKKKSPSSSDIKKNSSKTLKTGSKGQTVVKKKKKLDSDGIVGPKTIETEDTKNNLTTTKKKPVKDKKLKKSYDRQKVVFKYERGVHKVKMTGTKSVLTVTVVGRTPKIKSITRTMNGRTYKLKPSGKTATCGWDCPCGIECWEDPILKQSICVCKPCGGGNGGSGSGGSAQWIGPCD